MIVECGYNDAFSDGMKMPDENRPFIKKDPIELIRRFYNQIWLEDIKFLKKAYEGVTLDELYDIENEFVEKETKSGINKKMQREERRSKKTKRRRERSRDD